MNTLNDTHRLDILVSDKAKVTREQAKELIQNGFVSVNNIKVYKPGQKYTQMANIEINTFENKFVSRGGYKLSKAIEFFNIDIKNKICIDIGSSTGGFTDCLLQNGANLVYAIDSGTDQLVQSIKSDSRVISMEQTNIRNITNENLNVLADIIVIDVSFISITKVIDTAYSLLNENGECVCLIKPQFEVGHKNVNKTGVVKDTKIHLKVLQNIYDYIVNIGFVVKGITNSPIEGKKGNKEYLLYISKDNKSKTLDKNIFNKMAINIIK